MGTKGQAKSDAKGESRGPSNRDQKYASLDKQSFQGNKLVWTELMSGAILAECQLRFQVNFDREIFEIIREVR